MSDAGIRLAAVTLPLAAKSWLARRRRLAGLAAMFLGLRKRMILKFS